MKHLYMLVQLCMFVLNHVYLDTQRDTDGGRRAVRGPTGVQHTTEMSHGPAITALGDIGGGTVNCIHTPYVCVY